LTIQKEIEFKNLLEKKEFERLCKGVGITSNDFHSQTNTYFDTVDFKLRDAYMGFRLRVKGEHSELTLKAPGENLHTMIETTRRISTQERNEILRADTISPSMYEEFKQIEHATLKAFGSLRTNRAEIPCENGLLVLDQSEYLGHTDYEVEFEATDVVSGQRSFLALLEKFEIPKRNTPKKIARFMNAAKLK